ncbi:MAG: hypothetical protein A2V88_15010 [Elusimicrobia bacterium RBG_16_66_12]|nr:MAG: hypothetical protein A2V88_15010 [Elusimicrobia bacterium RBG_16_66_12]
MPLESLPNDYRRFLHDLKARIRAARTKAVLSVNRALIELYWDLGRQVVERQKQGGWGARVIERLSRDIRAEFPGIRGFSRQNIQYMRAFYRAWSEGAALCQQVAGILGPAAYPPSEGGSVPRPAPELLTQIPWYHNVVLIERVKDPSERLWYARNTVEQGWSRNVLVHQIESRLHLRQGKVQTNFAQTLPAPQSELAQEALKDGYALDFLATARSRERDIERGLIENAQSFLLELGKGFAFVGRQYHLEVGGEDFYIDLLFYNLVLRCYVVIELKAGAFRPEHAGKLSFYLSAVDDLLRHPDDRPSIGMVLCKSKNKVVVEYALRDLRRPIGVSSYRMTRDLPDGLAGGLPTTGELEDRLNVIDGTTRPRS